MIRIPNTLFKSIAVLCAAFMLHPALADEAPLSAPGQFTIQLPEVDRQALIEQLRTMRSQLILRKQALLQIVADQKLDGGDAFISLIMPGGLLYAGYKKARYEQANNELARVNADIEEFSGDLLAIESISAPVFVAQLP